jgi:hypothetical protein
MTKSMRVDYPYNLINYPTTAHEIESNNNFMFHQMGIDTIELVAKYETVIKLIEKMGFTVKEIEKNHKVYKKYLDEVEADSKKRLFSSEYPLSAETVELPKVNPKDKGFYITIVKNIPTLFDIATYHKKAKDSFCLIVFAGLHQPTKRISSEAIKSISKILKRKAFKLHSVDIAIDTTDNKTISYKEKGAFKDNLMPYSKGGVISKGSSLYINNTGHNSISRILYYDKYKKQKYQQGKEIIKDDLNEWKRLEVTLSFDVTKSYNRGFRYYIDSSKFIDDLFEIDEIANKAGIEEYERDYLTYQLSSLIDNRVMHNRESQEQFNSFGALERFKKSEFKRFELGLLDDKMLSKELTIKYGFEIVFE